MTTNRHSGRWQAVAVMVLAVVFMYDGRARDVETRTRSVVGCERVRVDRATQRAGWRTAEIARRTAAADPAQRSGRAANLEAADRYAGLVADLSSRIDPPFACQSAYPKVTFLGVRLGPDVPVEQVQRIP